MKEYEKWFEETSSIAVKILIGFVMGMAVFLMAFPDDQDVLRIVVNAANFLSTWCVAVVGLIFTMFIFYVASFISDRMEKKEK